MTDTEQGDVEKVARIVGDTVLPAQIRHRNPGVRWVKNVLDQEIIDAIATSIAALKASPPEGWDRGSVAEEPQRSETTELKASRLVDQFNALSGEEARTLGRAALPPAPLQGDQLAKLRAIIAPAQRVLATIDSGSWRDRTELSIAAHPAVDDLREALSATGGDRWES